MAAHSVSKGVPKIAPEPVSANSPDERFARLRPREKQVLRLAALPQSSKEIALQLGLSPRTVDNYITSAVATLEARDRRHAARLLIQAEQRGVEQKLHSQISPVALTGEPATTIAQRPLMAAALGHAGLEDSGGALTHPSHSNLWSAMSGAVAKGIEPDDVKPPMRLLAILLASVGLALCLAAAVILVDAFTRFARTIGT